MPRVVDLSRRQFLARSAGLASASLGLGVQAQEKSAGSGESSRIQLAFIGVGRRGTQLLGAALRIPGVRIAAIADLNPAHLRRAGDIARDHKPRLLSEAPSAFTIREVDAVFIATPSYLHRDHALEALAAGKHVYLEKPMALTAPDCRMLMERAVEAEGRGLIFQMGLQRRYNPRYRASIQAIHQGRAGKVLFIRAQWHSTGNLGRSGRPWYFQREKSGDIVLEQACHQMDVFNWVFQGEPVHACGLGGTHLSHTGPGKRDIRDHYGLQIEYPGSGMVHYSHLHYAPPDRRFAGVYELVFGEDLGVDLANANAWNRSGKAVELSRAGGNDTHLAVEGFLHSLRTGEHPLADARVGYSATMTSLLALRALDTGQRVSWCDLAG